MADLSDFLEDRLLEIVFAQSAYQTPTVIRVTTVDDTATYTVRVNETDYDYAALGGDTATEILDGLETALAAGVEFTATRFTDQDGLEALRIAQTATYESLAISVSATATGALSTAQEVFVALFTTAVGEDGSGTEVVNSGYARQILPMTAVAGGAAATSADVTFGPAGVGGYGAVTHAALYDAFTGGNLLLHSALVAPKTIPENDTFTFRAGDLTVALL